MPLHRAVQGTYRPTYRAKNKAATGVQGRSVCGPFSIGRIYLNPPYKKFPFHIRDGHLALYRIHRIPQIHCAGKDLQNPLALYISLVRALYEPCTFCGRKLCNRLKAA